MNTKKLIALFSVILALFVVLSVSVFADGEDETGDDTMVLFAGEPVEDGDTDTAGELDGDAPLLGAENDAETKGEGDTVDEPILTVGASDDTGDTGDGAEVPTVGAEDDTDGADSVDEDAAKEAADSVLDAVGATDSDPAASTDPATSTEPAETEPATGTWDNLGTSGIIGIVVAIVLCIAIIVVIIVLIPKKGGQKK